MPTQTPRPSSERPSSEPQLNQRRGREFEQLERALKDKGPCDAETLRSLVGGAYWQAGRFDKALSWATQKKLLVREDDGTYRLAQSTSA